MPEITVVITTYNLEKYIDRCLKELLKQTFRDFCVLIIDDCSKDKTVSIVRSYMEKYPDIIKLIISPVNQGMPGKVRNLALDSGFITGKYVIFLDGDDRIEPCFLEKLHTAAVESGAEVTMCAYDRFEEESGHVLCREMMDFPRIVEIPPKDDILAFVNGALWNKLILTRSIGELRIPDFKVGEDISFQLALFERCRKVVCLNEILIHYQVRTASVISNTPEESIYQFAEELHRLWEDSSHEWMKDTLALAAFIHIGISMPLRAYGNPNVDLSGLLRWNTQYLNHRFGEKRGRFLRSPSLLHHGVKGIGIWIALVFYKLHCFQWFLRMYTALTKCFHFEIKF